MRFKTLRQLEDDILNLVSKLIFKNPDEPGQAIQGLTQDVALMIADVHYELDSLRYKYNIEEKDLLPMMAVLSRSELIPARVVQRAYGEKNE